MTFSSFACARHSDEAPWLSSGHTKIYDLEVPANARLNSDSVAVVTWMLRTAPDPGDMHWTLELYAPAHPNIQAILVFKATLNEDNPLNCAIDVNRRARSGTPGRYPVWSVHSCCA
jgi:hypothetical protein